MRIISAATCNTFVPLLLYTGIVSVYVCGMFDLQTFMPVQQLSGVIHSIHSQADKVTAQQTVEVYREEFTLHQTKGVESYLLHQCKTCRHRHAMRVKYSVEAGMHISSHDDFCCAPHTCNEGDPHLHAPGEREHQEV